MQMLLEEPLLAPREMLDLYRLASRSISYVTQIFLLQKKPRVADSFKFTCTVHVLMPPVWHLQLHAVEHA